VETSGLGRIFVRSKIYASVYRWTRSSVTNCHWLTFRVWSIVVHILSERPDLLYNFGAPSSRVGSLHSPSLRSEINDHQLRRSMKDRLPYWHWFNEVERVYTSILVRRVVTDIQHELYIIDSTMAQLKPVVRMASTTQSQGTKPSLANFRRSVSWSLTEGKEIGEERSDSMELQNYMEGRVSLRESEYQLSNFWRSMKDRLSFWT